MACSSPARMPETKTLSLIASCEPALCTRSDGFLSMYGLDALADCRPTIICDYGPARREGVVKGCNHTTWAGGVWNTQSRLCCAEILVPFLYSRIARGLT